MQCIREKHSSIVPRQNVIFYEKYCDGILRTEDGTVFKIHRVILTQYEYFHALYSFEANNKADILMKGIGSQTLRQILQYIYEGTLQLDKEDVVNLLIAADYLLLTKLMIRCRDFAIRHMTPSSCLTLLTTALQCEHLNILRVCSRYVKVHFEVLIKNFPDKIADLPIEVFTELLKDNSLNITSEDTVWTAIVIWVKADLLKRNQHVPDLLNCIRFKKEKSLILKVVHNVIGIFNKFCLESNSFPHSVSKSSFLQRILYRETASRLPKCLHVVVSNRMSQSGMRREMYLTCDEKLDFWRKVSHVTLFPDTIFAIGKYVYLFVTNTSVFLRYDLLNDSLIPLVGIANRIYYCIAELDKKIYIVGGHTAHQYIHTVECYDPESNRWNPVKALYGKMLIIEGWTIIMAAAGMCGRLYVIGCTSNVFQRVMWMSVYDPTTYTWNTGQSPRLVDPIFSVVVFKNRLYLVGERNGGGLIYAGEYDPVLDAWRRLPDLPFKYLKPKLLVLAGRLLMFDNYHRNNYNKDRRPLFPAVYWDGIKRAWQITDKSFALYNSVERYRFVILDDPSVVKKVVNRGRRSTSQWERAFAAK